MSLELSRAGEEYVYTNTQPTTTKPITISAWIKCADTTNNQVIVSIGNAVNEFLILHANGATAGDPVRSMEYATAWKSAISSTGYSINTWHHVCGTFVSATERSVFIDGGSKVTNTDSQDVNFAILSTIVVGTHKLPPSGIHFDGKIAEVAIWHKELSDAQILDLAGGTSPSAIDFNDLAAHWPLFNNYLDATGQTNSLILGNGSPSFDDTDSPPVFNFPRAGDNPLNYKKRLVAAGNDEFWYESL